MTVTGSRILLIEDNHINAELMVCILAAWGHHVTIATDAEQGLQLVRRERPQLIISDVQMPDIDGYELARRIKADPELRHIPLLALTAYAMVGDRERARAAGFDAYFSKPIEPASFMAALQAFLPDKGRPPLTDASPPGPAPSAVPGELSAPRPRTRLLLADDGQFNLEFKRSLFEQAGYQLESCSDAATALSLLRSRPFDLVLSDVVMRGGSGLELLRQVRADPALRDTPFILLTSSCTDAQSQSLGLALGADRYLLRPIEPEALLAAIRDCLRGR